MEENYRYNDYESRYNEEHDYNNGYDEQPDDETQRLGKTVRGYRVVILLLVLLLGGVSAFTFNMIYKQKNENEALTITRELLQENLTDLIGDYEQLEMEKIANDTIRANIERERDKANEMIAQLKNERRLNYNAINKYKRELGTMRTVMKGDLKQIDSLNQVTKRLGKENVKLKEKIATANLERDKAKETASELQGKVKQGAVLRARDISMVALNAKDKEVSRMKQACKLRVDFYLSANELATPGNRVVYLRLLDKHGYAYALPGAPTFTYEGKPLEYSGKREVDYQNDDVAVSIYYADQDLQSGTYKVEIYTGGSLIGTAEIYMK